ncbi:hypothetical protein HN51_059607 [Arachis hypogaea]
MRRCGMVVDFYASCFLTVSQSSTATTLRWCFALNSLKLDFKTRRMFEEKGVTGYRQERQSQASAIQDGF